MTIEKAFEKISKLESKICDLMATIETIEKVSICIIKENNSYNRIDTLANTIQKLCYYKIEECDEEKL